MQFQCNICQAANEFQPAGFERDDASCSQCGSSVRLRAMLHALSVEIFGMPLALADFPPMKSIRGLGMTDQMQCASMLESRFDYRNTFYHEAPRFDVSQPPDERELFDFILAGDVFEHVAPPVEQSLANACALLKPHGFLALTVPYSLGETTQEHFAELHESSVATVGGHQVLVNRTRAGVWQVFENLVFHGGFGSTLELRVFGEADLRRKLGDAGFPRVEFAATEYPPFGIGYSELWSLPLIAAKGPFRFSRDGVAELVRQHLLLKEVKRQLKRLQDEHEGRTRWAMALDEEVKRLEAQFKRLQGELEDRTRWAMELDQEVDRRAAETARLYAETAQLYDELNRQRFRLASWEASRWTRLGRALGLGPKL